MLLQQKHSLNILTGEQGPAGVDGQWPIGFPGTCLSAFFAGGDDCSGALFSRAWTASRLEALQVFRRKPGGAKHPPVLVRSTLPNISESGIPSGLRGTLNELKYGKMSFFQSGEEHQSKSNESRNIDFHLLADDEFCAILSQNEHQDDPEQVV